MCGTEGILMWNCGGFGVELRGFWCGTEGFLVLSAEVCGTEKFAVWN